MGIINLLKRIKQKLSDASLARTGRKIPRFAPISEDDEMLEPKQVRELSSMIQFLKTEILGIADANDEMLPECSFFIPNLLAEFNENPKLAMIHGLGTKHAWIRISMLKEVLKNSPSGFQNYGELFREFTSLGYDIKKIKYIRFRSAM